MPALTMNKGERGPFSVRMTEGVRGSNCSGKSDRLYFVEMSQIGIFKRPSKKLLLCMCARWRGCTKSFRV